eukprot:g18983.t1
MVFHSTGLHAFAAAVALAAGGSSSMFAAALSVSVYECADLAPFTSGDALTEDVLVFIEGGVDVTCDKVTTVYVKGGYEFTLSSDTQNVVFTGVRFEITDGAAFTLNLATGDFFSAATFTGVTGQESNGGVFSVDSDSSATFGNGMVFDENSVTTPYHGGAVYAGGSVDFQYGPATFNGNEVMPDFDGRSVGGGGAVAVANTGKVTFNDFAYFYGNKVEKGGRGGAMENLGEAYFSRASYFMANIAGEDGDEVGGEGGAIYTGEGSTTTFKRRTIHHHNMADNGGGALWNEGTTLLMSNAFLKGNSAMGADAADGGHIWNSGELTAEGFVNLRDGVANRDGGAVFIAPGASGDVGGVVTLERNSAGGNCDDVYPCTP